MKKVRMLSSQEICSLLLKNTTEISKLINEPELTAELRSATLEIMQTGAKIPSKHRHRLLELYATSEYYKIKIHQGGKSKSTLH